MVAPAEPLKQYEEGKPREAWAYRTDDVRPPGRPFTVELLEDAIRAAVKAVTVPAPAGVGGGHVTWGAQLDVQPIGDGRALELGRCAGYLAKYATKATEQAGGVLHPVVRARSLA